MTNEILKAKSVKWALDEGIVTEDIVREKYDFVAAEAEGRVLAACALKNMGFENIKQEDYYSKYDLSATMNGVTYHIEAKNRNDAKYDSYMLSLGKYNALKDDENALFLTTTYYGDYIWDINSPDEFKFVKHKKYTAIESGYVIEKAPHYYVNNAIYKWVSDGREVQDNRVAGERESD